MAVKLQTDDTRNEEVNALINLCFTMFDGAGLDYKEIATKCDLSVSTIYRLYQVGGSQYCRIGTLQKLGAAAGFELKFSKGNIKISLAA